MSVLYAKLPLGHDTLVVDPDTYAELVAASIPIPGVASIADWWSALGLKVIVQSFGKEWHPPCDRFVEYEESDRGWLQRMGFGSMREVRKAYSYDSSPVIGGPLSNYLFLPEE